jgi:hypothetical protein
VVENFRAYRLDILGRARSFGNFHSFFSFDMNTSQFGLAQYVCDQWTSFFLVDPSDVIRSNLEKHRGIHSHIMSSEKINVNIW